MSIEKVGLNNTPVIAENKISTNFKGTTIGNVPDEEKSNAVKYMIGATALAAVIAVGVIGHKHNWWKAAKKAEGAVEKEANKTAEELKKLEEAVKDKKAALEKAKKEADEDAINKAKEELQNAEKALEEAKNKSGGGKPVEPKTEEVKAEEVKPEETKPVEPKAEEIKPEETKPAEPKAEEVKPEEPKPVEPKPEEVKPAETTKVVEQVVTESAENTEKWLKPFEELDCSDFSKVGGKSISSDYKAIYDKNGNRIRTFLKGDDGSISCISDFDPATDLQIKSYGLQNKGKDIKYVVEYNNSGNPFKTTYYREDGKTIKNIMEESIDGVKTKDTYFDDDGKSIIGINKNYEDGTSKYIRYNEDGSIKSIIDNDENHVMQKMVSYDDKYNKSEYGPDYNLEKKTVFYDDATTVKAVTEIIDDKEHITHYRKNGKIRYKEIEDADGNFTKKQSLLSRLQDFFTIK